MKNERIIQYALMCLRALERERDRQQALSAIQISRVEGVPLHDCQSLLDRLCAGGLIELTADHAYQLRRPMAELTAFDVVRALTTPVERQTPFRMLAGSMRYGTLQKTLQAVEWSQRVGVFPSDGVLQGGSHAA